jgi:hypothetical protein
MKLIICDSNIKLLYKQSSDAKPIIQYFLYKNKFVTDIFKYKYSSDIASHIDEIKHIFKNTQYDIDYGLYCKHDLL